MLHSRKNVLAVKAIPRSSDNYCIGVMLANERNSLGDLCFLCNIGVREDNTGRISYLVVIKLAEVLHIHLTLSDIGNGREAV